MAYGILLFGSDCDRLNIRARLLSLEGWNVTLVCKPTRTLRVTPETSFVLAIMCDTLAPIERDQAIAFTRALWPQAKIVVLTSAVNGVQNALPGITVVDGFEPGRLIVTCDRLIKAAWSLKTRYLRH